MIRRDFLLSGTHFILRLLNEISAFVWSAILEEVDFDTVLDQILLEYEVDRDTATNDLEYLISQFIELHLVEVVD